MFEKNGYIDFFFLFLRLSIGGGTPRQASSNLASLQRHEPPAPPRIPTAIDKQRLFARQQQHRRLVKVISKPSTGGQNNKNQTSSPSNYKNKNNNTDSMSTVFASLKNADEPTVVRHIHDAESAAVVRVLRRVPSSEKQPQPPAINNNNNNKSMDTSRSVIDVSGSNSSQSGALTESSHDVMATPFTSPGMLEAVDSVANLNSHNDKFSDNDININHNIIVQDSAGNNNNINIISNQSHDGKEEPAPRSVAAHDMLPSGGGVVPPDAAAAADSASASGSGGMIHMSEVVSFAVAFAAQFSLLQWAKGLIPLAFLVYLFHARDKLFQMVFTRRSFPLGFPVVAACSSSSSRTPSIRSGVVSSSNPVLAAPGGRFHAVERAYPELFMNRRRDYPIASLKPREGIFNSSLPAALTSKNAI